MTPTIHFNEHQNNLSTPQKGQQESQEQEYLTRFDLRTAFSNADKYIVAYNDTLESVKDHIRGGTLATYFRVLEAYVRQNNYIQHLADQPVPCRLNNCMLAYQLKVTRRTIINHLNKLEQAGFINKTFRGTYADYEITIPITVLLNIPKVADSNTENQPIEGAENPNNVKNVLPISLIQHLEKSNIPNTPCELVQNPTANEEINEENSVQDADTTFHGHFSCYTPKASVDGEENQPLSTAEYREQNLGAAGGTKNTGNGTTKKKFPAWQLAMVMDFYSYAIPVLYPVHEFDQQVKTKILNKLFSSVYGGFIEPTFTRKHWEEYHKSLFERVDMVAIWKDKPVEGNKYRFLVNPLTYFDKNCKYGFIKTEDWIVKKRKQMAIVKAEIELEKACKEMLKGSDRLKIYSKWETRFKNKKLAEIMPVFYRAMARMQQQLTEVKQTKYMMN